jgi:2'-5' RNA ligase
MTYIGLKVQNVPFDDAHLTIRYLGKHSLPAPRLNELKSYLSRYENLRFTVNRGSIDWFGENKDIPVVRVYGTVLDMFSTRIHGALNELEFYNKGFNPYYPHVAIPKPDYPVPDKFIVGPLYIENGKNPRIYFGA